MKNATEATDLSVQKSDVNQYGDGATDTTGIDGSTSAGNANTDNLELTDDDTLEVHYLDVGQMAYGVGLGYDWLYHEMTSKQRETVENAVINFAIKTALDPSYSKAFATAKNNWNPWCYGGLVIGACAVYESFPDECSALLSSAVTNIQNSIKPLAPLGAYPEGPGYYTGGMGFTVLFVDGMNKSVCLCRASPESSTVFRCWVSFIWDAFFSTCHFYHVASARHNIR